MLLFSHFMVQGATVAEGDSPAERPVIEPLRVLVASPLGPLGIEVLNQSVTSIRIVPDRKTRRFYTPFKKASRSDFLDEALGRLSEYFAGARRDLAIDYDLGASGLGELSQLVLEECAKTPYGTTRTYQKLASAIGQHRSYRVVRAALMANPLPILIPCHRVVLRKGGAGSYIAGTRKKQWLLKLESRGIQSV